MRSVHALLFLALLAGGGAAAQEAKPRLPDPKLVRTLKDAVVRAASAEKPENRARAQAVLDGAPRPELVTALVESLGHGTAAVRIFVARALAAPALAAGRERHTVAAVVEATVREARKEARIELFRTLRAFDAPDTSLLFLDRLEESEAPNRVRALLGLGIFRDRRSVPVLVEYLTQIVAGFHKAAIAVTIDRATISSWRVVSGGTGAVVVEVPEPEIGVVRTGVVMDVEVKKVEMSYVVGVLQDLTGESIGADPAAWRGFLAQKPDFELAPAKGE
jgi:hypothetical protein